MTFYRNNKVIVGVVIYSKMLIAEVCIYHLTAICPGFFYNGAVWEIYGLHVIIRSRGGGLILGMLFASAIVATHITKCIRNVLHTVDDIIKKRW